MTTRTAKPSPGERLRASPNFVLAFTLDGRPYVAKETEPYIQYWLTERYRILLAMFSRRGGATAAEAIDGYLRLTRATRNDAERKRLVKAIADMREAGVVANARDDVSRYSAKIVSAYVAHRPFPRELSDLIVRSAPVTAASRVLDLAGGPGDLALQLAQTSDNVSLMELSRGFVSAARARAKRLGVNLTPIHESCNRLVFNDDEYDVITVSQALHWLDDVLVCRGICRVLRPGGSFFVIHSSISLADKHPLSFVLGDKSILGHKKPGTFVDQIRPLQRRLALLFEALDAPDVQRIDPTQQWSAPGETPAAKIVPAGVSLFRQRRPFTSGYARGFLTPQHIAITGMTPDAFWQDLEARCASASDQQMLGTHEWAVLHFQRGGTPMNMQSLDSCKFVEIGYEPQAMP
jgi:2-polyprenyl-3-methyl-5-hydroxy-6-metoxy-1,4-benzoquinol methylase